ncbi:hypothetical protein ADL19_05185 [Streptomyces purpurogeneiscleroticus]|nr:hypothetical protein ADL19_05185 [Streptomyces purpurogeneiscleroticus]
MTKVGCLEPSMTPVSVVKDGGQVAGWPSGEASQSCARMSAPIAPPPIRQAGMHIVTFELLCITAWRCFTGPQGLTERTASAVEPERSRVCAAMTARRTTLQLPP